MASSKVVIELSGLGKISFETTPITAGELVGNPGKYEAIVPVDGTTVLDVSEEAAEEIIRVAGGIRLERGQ